MKIFPLHSSQLLRTNEQQVNSGSTYNNHLNQWFKPTLSYIFKYFLKIIYCFLKLESIGGFCVNFFTNAWARYFLFI